MKTELELTVNGKQVETVEEFCYLGSILTNNGNCRKEIRARIATANSAFNRLNNICGDRKMGLPIEIRLLYSAETWPLTKAEIQRHGSCTSSVAEKDLNISWKDMVHIYS